MTEPIFDFQMRLSHKALDMMARGVLIDEAERSRLDTEITRAMHERASILEDVLKRKLPLNEHGFPTLFRSTKQMSELFVALGASPGTNRKTGRPAYDDETLFALSKKKPGVSQVCFAIMEFRSLGQMLSTFVRARADSDGRMRCSFNTAGPESFRLSSSKNVFGRGTNLQNVTTGDRSLTGKTLPNLRRAIVPPPGSLLYEPDLSGADAQIVAWDSGDENMKAAFRSGMKIHAINSKIIFGSKAGPDGRTEPWYTATKRGVHASNYYAKPNTVAKSLGILVKEAEDFQKRLFGAYPGVPLWHKRIREQLYATKTISNVFGYRIVFFDRIDDGLVADALAWIGQGTVAQVANRAWVLMEENVPEAPVVLQEHDSLVGECELSRWDEVRPKVREQFAKVVVPYDDPLIIPTELKVSEKSWGDMEKAEW